MLQFYDGRDLPQQIIIDKKIGNTEALALALTPESYTPVKVALLDDFTSPDLQADLQALRTMALRNIEYTAQEQKAAAARGQSMVEDLQRTLSLQHSPRRIECIDISNFQGSAIVASNVCFIDGKPAKDFYRSYNIQSVTDGPDDYASIREVVTRRIERGLRDDDLPDLLIIDGGKGQLSAACDAKSQFPQLNLDIISLAKSRLEKSSKTGRQSTVSNSFASTKVSHSFERIFVPNQDLAISLRPGTPTFRIMTQIRDEAHRFAITKHRKKRQKNSVSSELDLIDGVGVRSKSILLKHFGSIDHIKKASLDELNQVKGIKASTAFKIYQHYQTDK